MTKPEAASQEETYQFSEAHYRLAMEAAGVGLWDWDLRHDLQHWSAQCRAIYGLRPGEKESYALALARIYAGDRERIDSLIKSSLRERTEYSAEYRVIWPDGSLHWIAASGQGMYDEAGKATRMIGVAFDVTARKEAEEARRRADELVVLLEKKRAFLQAIMHQVPAGLIIAEAPRGNVIFYSEESTNVLGHATLESEGYEDYALYGGLHTDGTPYRAEEYPLARALLKGEAIMQEDMLYQCEGSKLARLSVSAAPIRDARGQIMAAVVAFNDVSERYELERKKDEFISMASHELRTPLTSIKGNLQLAQRRLRQVLERNGHMLEADRKGVLEHVVQWNERALSQVNVESRLVNDLLDASRIQRRGLRVLLEPDNLARIVSETVNDLRVVAPARVIELELPERAEVPVLVDRVRIGQVISHYIVNALKYSPEDQPVRVGLALEGREARVWVKDAGSGIAPEALDLIWDRFRRLGSFGDNTHLGGGLGLGLYINHALIQLHGGRSGVESAAGKGSTFWFTLAVDKR